MASMCLLFEESSGPSPHRGVAHAPRELPATPQAQQYFLTHAAPFERRRDEIERQFSVASPRDGAAEFFLVGGENLDALPTPRDGDIPLLRIRCGAHGGIAKENVIHGLAL